MKKKITVGEQYSSFVTLNMQNGAQVPFASKFEVRELRNGSAKVHEHVVREADWSLFKQAKLEIIECSCPELVGTMFWITRPQLVGSMQSTGQGSWQYRFHQLLMKRLGDRWTKRHTRLHIPPQPYKIRLFRRK